MRSIWTGTISFGLVTIPVKLYSGSQSNSLDLDMLRRSDLCPVKYRRVCAEDEQEIPYEEIVKGFEYSDGNYIVLTDEDFQNANVEQTKRIDILDFVKETEIDSRYFEKPYYLEPDRAGEKPYALLREALKKSKKVGIANYVLRNRGRIGLVKPVGNAIILNQMRYVDEVRNPGELNLPETKAVKDKEIDLALSLIDQWTTKFDPKKYKDTYIQDLKRIIEEKAKGKQPKAKGKAPQPTKVVDMMTLLKKSLKDKKTKAA
jgi:DNA end-binding protein Ku